MAGIDMVSRFGVPWLSGVYLYVLDLVGVAVFAISGALAAGRRRLGLIGVLVLASVTAVGGGTVRDVVPAVLQQGSLYAAAAIAGTSLHLVLARLGLEHSTAGLTGMAVVAGLRLAAIWWGRKLPVFEVRTSELPIPPRSKRK